MISLINTKNCTTRLV